MLIENKETSGSTTPHAAILTTNNNIFSCINKTKINENRLVFGDIKILNCIKTKWNALNYILNESGRHRVLSASFTRSRCFCVCVCRG